MKKNKKIESLQSLRARKIELEDEMRTTENEIRYDLYMYTHPVDWAANAISQTNGNFSAQNLVKIVSYSRSIYKYGRMIFQVVNFFRKMKRT